MRCLPGSLRNPPYQVTFHQSSLESSTSMIRSPGLGGESWAAYGAGRTCPLHIPIVLGPQILCIPLSWGRILDALGRRIPRDHRHSRYSPGQNWAGAGAMPSAPITLGFWAALLLSGLSGLKHTRRRFLKGPLMSQGLGAQSPEAGARRRPSRADTEKTYCRARSLFSWGRNL